jgi:aspartyl-tRNA(Asn)/glutamyl-tRNA(Gln) amidotransferase subunit C
MIENKDVEYVSWLARLDLTEEERQRFTRQLGQVLEHAEKIRSLDTEGVEPTSHPIPLKNVLRDDEVRPCLTQAEALSAAPRSEGGYFVVPKIV